MFRLLALSLTLILSFGCSGDIGDTDMFYINPNGVIEKARRLIELKMPDVDLGKYEFAKLNYFYYAATSIRQQPITIYFWKRGSEQRLTKGEVPKSYQRIRDYLTWLESNGNSLNVYDVIVVDLDPEGDLLRSKVRFDKTVFHTGLLNSPYNNQPPSIQ